MGALFRERKEHVKICASNAFNKSECKNNIVY
jgi:hypothetical protein